MPDRARIARHLARAISRIGVAVLGATLALSSLAQDNNSGDCAANGSSDSQDCAEKIADPATGTAGPGATLDWVEIDQVPEKLRDRRCVNCAGRYIDPLAGEDDSVPPEKSEIKARAEHTELRDDEAILSGGATAAQGYRRAYGDTVVINRVEESATLTGNVTLREPNVLLLGETAKIYTQTGEAFVDNGQFVFHDRHMRGLADRLERDTEGLVHIHDGTFTYCAPLENDWGIHADNLELDFDEGLGTARNARVEVEDVPIFYTPYLSFPLDDRRRTGLLWPDFGNDSTGGLDVTLPVYFNLAPNYDALYSPRFIEERGVNHELKFRYLNPYIGAWTLGGAYMLEDDRYQNQVDDDDSSDRWIGVVKQDGLFQQRWRSQIDYSKASDVDYLKDLETTSLQSQRETSLLQLASMDYLGDSWLHSLEVQQFQSLAEDIREDYKKLPQLTSQYRGYRTPFELEPVLLAQLSSFDSDEDRVTGQRIYGEAGLSYPMLWPSGFLTPTVKWRQLSYDLSEAEQFPSDSPSSGAPMANLDGGLYFDRFTSFAGKNLLQTLEPRVYYLYSEYDEQTGQPDFDSAELTFTYNQLFRETRFAGHDRIDDSNQASVGITTRFVDEATGRSLLSASIGQIYYLRDRQVRLLPTAEPLDDNSSEIAGGFSFAPTENFGMRTNVVYDPFSDDFTSGNFVTTYARDNGAIFNVGYSYRRLITGVEAPLDQPPTEEASVSSYLPLTNNWSVFGAVNYSLEEDTSVEDMVGVEYDSCCWTFRLLHLRYYNNVSVNTDFSDPDLEQEKTLQFQVILKGLGGYGNQITDIMQDMIRGFEEREY